MGVPAVSHKSYWQLAKATTWGTGVAATIKLPLIDESIELENPPIEDNVLHGNPWDRTTYQGYRRAMGSITTQLLFEGMLEIFRGLFGTYPAPAVVETGVRDHVFKIGPTLNHYTHQLITGDVPTGKCFRVPTAKFDKMILRGTAGLGEGTIVTAEFGNIGIDRENDVTITGALSFPPLLPVKFDLSTNPTMDDGTADAAGDVRIRQFEITLENKLTDSRFYGGSPLMDEPVRGGKINATFKFMQEFQTKTQVDAYKAGTIGSPKIILKHPATIGASSNREFEIRANQAYIVTDPKPPVRVGDDVLISTVTWKATFDGVDGSEASPIVCRIRNTEAALA